VQRLGPRVALAALLGAALLQASCASSAGGPVGGPGRPTHVNASAWTTSAIVRWQAPAKTGTAPIVAYRVVSEPAQVAAVFAGDQTWGDVRGLTNGVAYTFTVTAVNGAKRTSPASPRSNRVMPSPVVVHVRGNQLVDGEGRGVRLFGVNRSGTEYSCVIGGAQGAGIFSGPSGAASIAAMASWRINAVRVPLNEDCWLGINGVNPAYSGRSYRDAIVAYVERLNRAGLVAVLDLHWNAPGTVLSEGQQVMADADHSPAFWASVATTFLAYAGVMFDLYNEPKDVSWECWRSGCVSPPGWRTAGMQSLIEVVRATGARQPIVVSGLNNANDLSRWLDAGLADPLHQLVAGLHMYNTGPPGYCNASPCWDATVAPVAARVPVITTEVGEFDRGSAFVTGYLDWAEAQARIGRDVSYAAWSWDVALGVGGPSLVSSYDGVPTAFGTGIRAYFQGLWERGEIQQG
jgi:endoglucanase